MVAGDREHGPVQASEEPRGPGELSLAAAVTQVAAGDHELRLKPLDQDRRAVLDGSVVPRSVMKIGQVQNACKHGRGRL